LLFGLADLDRGPEILPSEPPDVRNPTLAACNLQRASLAKWVKFNKNDKVNEHCLAIPKAPYIATSSPLPIRLTNPCLPSLVGSVPELAPASHLKTARLPSGIRELLKLLKLL
jgi:hypothetical protein